MPNRLESRDIDMEEIYKVPINAGMINNAKFSLNQYVSDDQGDGSNARYRTTQKYGPLH